MTGVQTCALPICARGAARPHDRDQGPVRRLLHGYARAQRRGRTIGIKVRFDDFTTVTRARSLDAAVNETETVGTVALELLRRLDPSRPVRLLGVRVAGLDEESAQVLPDDQLSLSL